MEEQLKILLNKIYELEGIVHLALKRDVTSMDFLELISKKSNEVRETSQALLHHLSPSESNFKLDEYYLDEVNDSNNSDTFPMYLTSSKAQSPSSSHRNKGKLVFSVNERFRFKKELFDNSDTNFNNTLALVASMDTYDEAEEYFLNEEHFDKNDQVVAEFLNVIKRYFI